MMSKEVVKEYSNGELTVVWKPDKCIHSGICVNTLPDVYDPEARPWITPENASTDELKEQISQCPSGALSYKMNNEDSSMTDEKSTNETEVEALSNGPLMVYGQCKVKNSDGSTEVKTKATAFCRCGASSNKPYCDGQHKKIGFEG